MASLSKEETSVNTGWSLNLKGKLWLVNNSRVNKLIEFFRRLR